MKFSDILEAKPIVATPEQEDIINAGRKYKSVTEFRKYDSVNYEKAREVYWLFRRLTNEWGKIPKTPNELIKYSEEYNNPTEMWNVDRDSWDMLKAIPEVYEQMLKKWSSNYNKKMTDDFIKSSELKYRMIDPNRPGYLVPRFNYDRLRKIETYAEDITSQRGVKKRMIPANSIYCKRHNLYFPLKPLIVGSHLRDDKDEVSGCPKCRLDVHQSSPTLNKGKTLDEWIETFKKNSSNLYPSNTKDKDKLNELKYDYSKSWISYEETKRERENDKTRVKARIHNIECKIHKVTFANDDRGISCSLHASGQSNCPECNKSESVGEDKLHRVLLKEFSDFKIDRHKNMPGLLSPKGFKLNFDRYVETKDEKIAFEFDGNQHFYFVNMFHNDDEMGFYYQVACDIIKNNYCKRNGIKLIRIGYRDSNNLETEVKRALMSISKPGDVILSRNYLKRGWNTPDMKKNDPYLYRYLKQYNVLDEVELKLMNLIK